MPPEPPQSLDVCDTVAQEVEEVFRRYGIVGVVSFVRVTEVQAKASGRPEYTYDWEGQANVLVCPEEPNEVCTAAALRHLTECQSKVTLMLQSCQQDASQRAALMRCMN